MLLLIAAQLQPDLQFDELKQSKFSSAVRQIGGQIKMPACNFVAALFRVQIVYLVFSQL